VLELLPLVRELLERVVDSAERAIGFGTRELANVRTKLELRALISPKLLLGFDQRAA
jgi:hypothetical protein